MLFEEVKRDKNDAKVLNTLYCTKPPLRTSPDLSFKPFVFNNLTHSTRL